MSYTLREADRMLKNTYLDLVSKQLNKKHRPGEGKKVACCECGAVGRTMRKTSHGEYICDKCFKELENER